LFVYGSDENASGLNLRRGRRSDRQRDRHR